MWPFSSAPSSPDSKTPVDTPPQKTTIPSQTQESSTTSTTNEKTVKQDEDAALAQFLKDLEQDEEKLRTEHFKKQYSKKKTEETSSSDDTSSQSENPINRRLKESLGILPRRSSSSTDSTETTAQEQDPRSPTSLAAAQALKRYKARQVEEKKVELDEREEEEVLSRIEMRCLTHFDRMWYCYSVGGQFLNVYRYGTLRDCSDISADWRFCMRSKMLGEKARREAYEERYKEKAKNIKKGANSEDIWTLRKADEVRDNVFWPKEGGRGEAE